MDQAKVVLPAHCAKESVPPSSLDCTGLYRDSASKALAANVRAYAPAIPLWSDGVEKERWISLPSGTTIDAADPNEWRFPDGTKVWKEFKKNGKRLETRLFQKVKPSFWVHAAYVWNADESSATLSKGGDILFEGQPYHVPTSDECEQCHRGRTERILGFEAVSLALEGASGLTLSALAAEDLIYPSPASTQATIGDDGTGAAIGPLGWLHINCGATCHNANANSTGYGGGLRLRLDPRLLDGRSSRDFDSLKTTINAAATTPRWNGAPRIIPGDPDHSLLVELIAHRGKDQQMPPIASSVVDDVDVARVVEWVRRIPR